MNSDDLLILVLLRSPLLCGVLLDPELHLPAPIFDDQDYVGVEHEPMTEWWRGVAAEQVVVVAGAGSRRRR